MLGGLLKLGSFLAEETKPLAVHSGKCTHSRHKSSSCNECIKVCPNDSITIENGISVDWSCNGCGLCTSVCPTEALELKDLSIKEYYSITKEASESSDFLSIKCKKSSMHKGNMNLTCLGQLDETAVKLAIIKGVKQFFFNTELCSKCEWKKGLELFTNRQKNWKKMWPEVKWIENIEPKNSLTEEKEPDKNIIDRREFFKAFGNESREIIVKSIVAKKEDTPWKNGQLSAQKSIRLQVHQYWIQSLDFPLMDKSLEVDSNCTFCGICEKVCPTNAIDTDDVNKKLIWNKEQCIDCSLCKDVCYRKAITFN